MTFVIVGIAVLIKSPMAKNTLLHGNLNQLGLQELSHSLSFAHLKTSTFGSHHLQSQLRELNPVHNIC